MQQAVQWSIDSQGALTAINHRFNRHPIAIIIHNKIKHYSKHVCLNWIKGHMGTIGNEHPIWIPTTPAVLFLMSRNIKQGPARMDKTTRDLYMIDYNVKI